MNQNLRIGIRQWNRKSLFLEQRNVLEHSPPCFVEAILDGIADARESFKFGRIETEERPVVRGFDSQGVSEINHDASFRRLS
jgi:hypothetical protein